MLEVREATKHYDGRAVVNRISFDVHAGEIFALLGPNGAGKTTLIRMITDILKPDSGTIRLGGHTLGSPGAPRISYLPEERGLYKRMKVLDVLDYYGRLKGLAPRASRAAATVLLERVELPEVATKQVQTLSKGMQQKLQIATTMIGDPRLLILDEPFSGLDPLNVQLLEGLLHERRADGTTILLSTHQMNKVEELCDRALMINHGHMVLYGTVREFRTRYADHAVVVRTEAELRDIPGVSAIAASNGDLKLTLESSATPQSVLQALVQRGIPIESFGVATLPLEDVFVKVVREGLGLDRGASTTVEAAPEATVAGHAGGAS